MSTSAFTGFVLLSEAKFDIDKFLKDLKEDLKIIRLRLRIYHGLQKVNQRTF